MDAFEIIVWTIVGVGGAVFLYFYVRHLSESGYTDNEIHLHLIHDVPLALLRRRQESNPEIYSGSPYKKRAPEHETVSYDDYPSYYGANYDPSTAAQWNVPPRDEAHNQQLLASGGWRCQCGGVHASYVSSCSCGSSKSGDPAPAPVPVPVAAPASEEDEVKNAAAIREYKKLLDDGIITAEEFEAKKKQLLNL